ncbi:hypothetical protein Taro_047063 [Colocasia esculenta]|uniref:Uncharacterized protein n=1 Tax=Colocasia esculenta TaxID=4460 RepID=A0A843WRS5_COLES|nr:hypothetical protein [Colocasia esculenta]
MTHAVVPTVFPFCSKCHLRSLNAGRQPAAFPPEGPKGKPCPRARDDTPNGPRKHPRQTRCCRALLAHRDPIVMGRATVRSTASRQGSGPRQEPCRDRATCRDNHLVATGN